ncbi:MAG TPA: aminotransferase class III-fold pyridoxal phosphate-dependent enzyme, partial [Spongiibacteraceae bacterium]|nr:aminotransferase class III-fold pyridoxal phosphate-dependent enzyme [Spongiibacteraceae bacterium]
LVEHARELGDYFLQNLARLRAPLTDAGKIHGGDMQSELVRDVRGRGLFIGVELNSAVIDAHAACEVLLRHGILTKDTHATVLRFAPPLTITRAQIDAAFGLIESAFIDIYQHLPRDLRAG